MNKRIARGAKMALNVKQVTLQIASATVPALPLKKEHLLKTNIRTAFVFIVSWR
jgi:hypothetical protein